MVRTLEGLSWDGDGCFLVRGVLSIDDCDQLLDAALGLLRTTSDEVVVRFEDNLPAELPPEHRVSKLYRLHRQEPFRTLSTDGRLLDHVQPLIGGATDIFLSQVVWKVPGALGQPWHQDASIFPFEPARPVIGTWLALTRADETNGCLQVVPGSHREPLLAHRFDHETTTHRDEGPTKGRYLRLEDRRVDDPVALLIEPGDLFVFDSHLLHASMDNVSDEPRVALTFHFASAGTTDRTVERFGMSPYNDWMPVWRAPQ